MTIQPSPYDLIRAIQDQQAVQQASFRTTDRLLTMLAGMLDGSAPDPIMESAPAPVRPRHQRQKPAEVQAEKPPEPKADFTESPAPTVKRERRKSGESARPPVLLTYGGIDVRTTERRALLLQTLRQKPMTLSELTRARVAPTVDGVKAQIIDLNKDLQKAGVALKVEPTPGKMRVGARGGREPSYYRLVSPFGTPNAPPEIQPSIQSGGEAGASPEEGTPASAAGDGEDKSAQGVQSVTSSGAGEGEAPPAEPAPAADEPPKIEKLAAVDVDRIYGPGGMVYVRETAARALNVLKHGDMFGLDLVAKRAGCPSAEVVRQALNIERASLAQIGLDLYLDKVNVRLRGLS
ncbi:hypothetical protein OIU35_31725 [Boseaceae bacterium BT-24-1]|nr:hypothetical protein [Boseaceae bacterium BT-24-1]